VLACRVVEPDRWCRRCGCEGTSRDTVTRQLAHEPLGWRPTTLLVRLCRYRCTGCGMCGAMTSKAADARAKLSRHGRRWALEGIVVQHLTVARVVRGSGCRGTPPTTRSWPKDGGSSSTTRPGSTECRSSASTSTRGGTPAAAASRRNLPDVVVGRTVTVIIDLTGVRDGTGHRHGCSTWSRAAPTRLPAVAERARGRVARRCRSRRDGRVHRVQDRRHRGTARRGRGHCPFHVVRLAGDALDQCRRRVQQHTRGRRGRNGARTTPPAGPCTPAPTCSPTSSNTGWRSCSPTMSTCRSRRPGGSTSG
jgi:hypothetical protein